jgi:hypothetical protein
VSFYFNSGRFLAHSVVSNKILNYLKFKGVREWNEKEAGSRGCN